jgi:integrase
VLIAESDDVNDDLAVCLRLAAATGPRRGELVAPKWVDFKGPRLTNRRSIVQVENQLFERWVFSFDGGISPWRPDYLTLAFARLSSRSCRLHDLRHFYDATQLLAAGVPAPTVSKRLGHTSTAVTLDVYGYWLPEQDRDAAER